MTNDERNAILIGLKALEPLAGLIPSPGNILVVAALHGVEDAIAAGNLPDAAQLESMRLAVYDRLQDRIKARFAPPLAS